MLEKKDFSGRQEGEQIVDFVRSHPLYLLWRLLPPAIFSMAALAIGIVLLTRPQSISGVWIFLGLWLLFLLLLWLTWRFALWYYDYFIITDRRVIDFVRRPFTSETRNETQLGRIQDARVVFPNSLALALNFGHVIVQTAGMTGQLEFRYAPHPHRLQAKLLELAAQHQGPRAEAGSLSQLIGALRTAFDAPPAGAVPSSAPQPSASTAKQPRSPQGPSRGFRDLIFVRPAPGTNTKTWRKHWLMLLRAIFRPAIVLAVAIALLFLVENEIVLMIVLVLLGIGVVAAGWQALDWYNDTYQVTEDRIIDVEKVPFIKEDRREARLTMIQDVNYNQPNFISRLFGFGDVVVQTAGRSGAFTFSSVPNPQEVQREISQRWEQARRAPQAPVSAEAAQDFVGLLDRYHDLRHKRP